MWTYNVVRQLVSLAGKTPWPEKVPPDESATIREALSKPADAGHIYCIKTHCALPVDRDDIKIICNVRDIRDATLSFMRFMKCPFEAALQSARDSMQITDHYLGSASLSVLPVDYDDLVLEPAAVVARVADFIGVDVDDKGIDGIVSRLSRDRVAARLEELAAVDADSVRYARIRNLDGSARVYDYETGFQSNHITSNRDAEWREVLDADQQRMLNELLGDWLLRYGYEL